MLLISRSLRVAMFGALVIALGLIVLPRAAQASQGPEWGDHANIDVYNFSDVETWVDVSWSYWGQGWHIDKAFCLKPKESYKHHISYNHPSLQPQVRVRAEIKPQGCRGATQTVVSGDGRIVKYSENLTVTIGKHDGRYFMTFPGTR